jgi:prepilin-type processing-associated H-X9-DG protein
MILGIMSIFTCFLTAPLGIIFGIISLVKISKSNGQLKGSGMAVAGIAVPVVALPIVAILMGILMPALAKARMVGQQAICINNLKQLSVAATIYAEKYGNYPSSDKWCDLLKPYYKNEKILICPSAKRDKCDYAINPDVRWNGRYPATTVLFFESKPGWNQSGGPDLLAIENHYKKGSNVAFCDGHVEFVKPEDIGKLKWKSEP